MSTKSDRAVVIPKSKRTIVVVTMVALVAAGTAGAGLALASEGGRATAVAPARSATVPAPPSTIPSSSMPGTPVTPPSSVPPVASTVSPPVTTVTASTLISDTCLYSHEANDDPILMPGQAGQSMAHDFFGNSTTGASSTASELVGGANTCSTSDDASAYWTPVLYQNGQAITPTHNLIYWSGLQASDPTVSAPPAGLEMIAGDESAMTPQSTKVVAWRCDSPVVQVPSATPVNCAGTQGLELRVTFPSCWDGTTLGGASQTNVVYPSGARCPAAYPVRIPVVVFHVVYPITSDTGLTLSMGPGQQGSTDTAHGDFINGWNQDVLARLIAGCASPIRTCGHVTGAQAVVHPKKV
jgi:hypothetical protein